MGWIVIGTSGVSVVLAAHPAIIVASVAASDEGYVMARGLAAGEMLVSGLSGQSAVAYGELSAHGQAFTFNTYSFLFLLRKKPLAFARDFAGRSKRIWEKREEER